MKKRLLLCSVLASMLLPTVLLIASDTLTNGSEFYLELCVDRTITLGTAEASKFCLNSRYCFGCPENYFRVKIIKKNENNAAIGTKKELGANNKKIIGPYQFNNVAQKTEMGSCLSIDELKGAVKEGDDLIIPQKWIMIDNKNLNTLLYAENDSKGSVKFLFSGRDKEDLRYAIVGLLEIFYNQQVQVLNLNKTKMESDLWWAITFRNLYGSVCFVGLMALLYVIMLDLRA